jgi:2-polyprenyl-3-methyl-5-hydroxy-6-metoxy-1,4-benzoquinol methylase
LDLKLKEILEIGAGNEVVKNCLQKFVNVYKVMDINEKLKPDFLADLRKFKPELREKFDCVVCAEVLEHMPFEDLEKNLTNIYNYLRNNGKAIITIPHRRARILIITPLSYLKPLIITLPFWIKSSLKSFYQQVIKKKVWIDPHHCWEIGDGKINLKDVEEVMKELALK